MWKPQLELLGALQLRNEIASGTQSRQQGRCGPGVKPSGGDIDVLQLKDSFILSP